jgi:putative FmdB family regulatory protein
MSIQKGAMMPIFEYLCTKCGHHFEKLLKYDTSHAIQCPACGSGDVKKELSTFSSSAGSASSAACYSGG